MSMYTDEADAVGPRVSRLRVSGSGARVGFAALLLVVAATVPAVAAPAQQAETVRVAQLEARVAALEAILEQLQGAYVGRLADLEKQVVGLQADLATSEAGGGAIADEPAAPPGDTDLEAAIARALAEIGEEAGPGGGPATPAPDETRNFDDKARNLAGMNPEISVTGDMFGAYNGRSGDPDVNKFQISEFELAFQAPLDPFSEAKAFVVFEDGEFEVEEMFINWTTLPAGLGLKVGRMRNDFGKLNRWHQHALPQSDRPAVHNAFFGEEGLAGIGISASLLPGPFLGDYNEFWVQVTNDENDVAFSGREFDNPVITVHETNYWDLSDSTYFELGLSASTGVNDELGKHRSTVYGADFNLNWSPKAEALYKGFEMRGEVLYQRRGGDGGTRGIWGSYLYGTRKLGQQLYLGVRGDWTQLPEIPGAELWGVSPYVEWWQSEWTRARLQYSYNSRGIEEDRVDHRFFIQITWALGPHKHEKY